VKPRAGGAGAGVRALPFVRLLLASFLLAGLAGLAACSSLSSSISSDAEMLGALRAHGVDPAGVIVPWEVNDEMRRWVHAKVPDNLAADNRLDALLGALLGSDGLALTYEAGLTPTAEQAFASRHANCLGFTSLFVGMARELGIDAFYLDVGDLEKFEREGSLVIESGHITAGYSEGSKVRILEFTPVAKPDYHQIHRVSDLTAIALFYSNRGAELVQAAKDREALDWLHKAVRLDPELARAWINLGVALRRTGDMPGAEAAYRKALEGDPQAVAAYQNLAALLFATGRSREGDELMALSSRLDSRNPFNLLALGDLALAHARYDEARRFYRRAERVAGAAAEAEAALGQLALATGDRGAAKRWLRKASSHDADAQRVRSLAAALSTGEAPAAPARRPVAAPPISRQALTAPLSPAMPVSPAMLAKPAIIGGGGGGGGGG
jgi:tetratricopeptide (TPR) repeat protein